MTREEAKELLPVVQTYVDDEKREIINEPKVKWSNEEPTKVKLVIDK